MRIGLMTANELNLSRKMKYQVKTLLFLCFQFTVFTTSAQRIHSISAEVFIEPNMPAFGNAIALSPTDSALISGTNFWEGRFTLSNLDHSVILLKLSSLEFQDTYITVEYEGEEKVDLGELRVPARANELDGITVSAAKPLSVTKSDGTTVVNIENTALATGTSVVEVLSRAPSIIVDQDNNFQVVGKGRAVLYVNGKRVDNARLSTISPSQISSFEIITNPGPKYDAEGNAVIDIYTKKPSQEELKATLRNYYTVNRFSGNNNRSDLGISAVSKKWSFNGNYALRLGNYYRQILRTSRTRSLPDEYFNSDLVTDWRYENDHFSNYALGIQYDPNEHTSTSIEYAGSYEDGGGNQFSENTITLGETDFYKSVIALDNLDKKHTVNFNYAINPDSSKYAIFFGSQYSNFNEAFANTIRNESEVEEGLETTTIDNLGGQSTEIISNQVDFSNEFDPLTGEVGLKYWYVKVNSNTDFLDQLPTGEQTKDDELSNSFNYLERVSAAYANIKGNWGKSNYSVGIRAELTNYELNTTAGDGSSLARRFYNFFPNAAISKTFEKDLSLFLTFSSRINRASYNGLNPFVIYQDQFTSIQGNANLQPARVYSLETGGSTRGWDLKLGYNYTRDLLMGGAFQSRDDPRVYILQRYNMSEEHVFFLSLSKNVSIEWWQSTNSFNLTSSNMIDGNDNFIVREQKPFFYLYSQNTFDLVFLKLYVTGSYQSQRQDGIYNRRSHGFVNIGLEKRFLADQLKVNLELNDALYTVQGSGEYELGETFIIFDNQYSTNYFRCSVTFDFGKLTKSRFSNKKVGASEAGRAN